MLENGMLIDRSLERLGSESAERRERIAGMATPEQVAGLDDAMLVNAMSLMLDRGLTAT